jgi:hypothetical protein
MTLRAAVVLCALLAVALLPAGAAAKECQMGRSGDFWKHEKGSFKRVRGTKTWHEYNAENEKGGEFKQIQTEGTAFVLHSKDRNVDILLREDLAGIRNKGEQQFNQLYGGAFLKSVDCTK